MKKISCADKMALIEFDRLECAPAVFLAPEAYRRAKAGAIKALKNIEPDALDKRHYSYADYPRSLAGTCHTPAWSIYARDRCRSITAEIMAAQ